MNVDNWYIELQDAIPEFQPDMEMSVDGRGQLLGHPIMGDLYRFAEEHQHNPDLFARVIAFINQAAQSEDDYVTEIVHASFMEHVPESEIEDAILPLLNDEARAMYDAIVNWVDTYKDYPDEWGNPGYDDTEEFEGDSDDA